MSGICGIISLDGRPPAAAELEAILEPLRRRGPDAQRSWLDGPAALGHTLLATTPEALEERLPLVDPDSGSAIVADARLDNREELLAALAADQAGRVIGDGELILRAYLKWNEECASHLLGDFAFAIWDAKRQRLLCARDQIGMRQLHYCHLPGQAYLFATEPAAVLAHPLVPRQLNEGRIADFLANLETLDLEQTFFDGIFRLPPAHVLTVTARGMSCRRYWEAEPEPQLKLGSDREYAAAFLDVFSEAVRCRLRSNGPVGAMLSGGTDSTAVAAVAARELATLGAGPLHTFSALGPDAESCVETRAITAAMTIGGIAPVAVNHAELGDYLKDLVRLAQSPDQPFEGWMTLLRAIYLAAHRKGINVVLDGVGADNVVDAGWVIAHHLQRGRILDAARESIADARFAGPGRPAYRPLLSASWRAFVPPALRELRHRLSGRLRDPHGARGTLMLEDFARRVDLPERRRRWRQQMLANDGLSGRRGSGSPVHPYLVVARERYDRIAAALAIEPRDPFCDLRVVKFARSLPPNQRRRDGWPKFILRNAVEGLVPDAVRWRRGKEHLGRNFTAPVFERLDRGEIDRLSANGTIAPYVDLAKMNKARSADPGSNDFANWQDVVYLALWLDSVAGMLGGRSAARKEG